MEKKYSRGASLEYLTYTPREGSDIDIRSGPTQSGCRISAFFSDAVAVADAIGTIPSYLRSLSRRHCKPIPSFIPAILLEIIPIKILYKISIETHTII
jgi:hypothetical protein